VFLVVTFLVMVITRIGSKDPARDLAGGLVAQEQVDEVRELYRLDEPFVVQYGHWIKNLVTLDFGYSYAQNQSVNDMMKQRLLPSFFIGIWAMFIGLLLAVPAAIYSAYRRDGVFDHIVRLSFDASHRHRSTSLILHRSEVEMVSCRLQLRRSVGQPVATLQEFHTSQLHSRTWPVGSVDSPPPC
jgi:hypothetical protein